MIELSVLEQYFEAKAFEKFVKMVDEKRKTNIYTCFECQENLFNGESEESIRCDGCLFWIHIECVDEIDETKVQDKGWFCSKCEKEI